MKNIKWTSQQLEFHACEDKKIRLIAFAGAAKSTSLIGYALRYPRKRFLYLAFTRSVADEAKTKFPKNVVCLSTHQLAWKAFGKLYKHKMAPNLRLTALAKALGSDDGRSYVSSPTRSRTSCAPAAARSIARICPPSTWTTSASSRRVSTRGSSPLPSMRGSG